MSTTTTDTSKAPKYFLATNDTLVRQMFGKRGFERVFEPKDADIVVFTGGEDIHPMLYGEGLMPKTRPSYTRDKEEIAILRQTLPTQFKVGICRGAQFLNVMVGNGRMYQHVDGHATNGGHFAWEPGFPHAPIKVSSTHHQMMIPGPEGKVLLHAEMSTRKECERHTEVYDVHRRVKERDDVECVLYPDHNTLCFQPHPEYPGKDYDACQQWFFDAMETYFLTSAQVKAAKALALSKAMNTK